MEVRSPRGVIGTMSASASSKVQLEFEETPHFMEATSFGSLLKSKFIPSAKVSH